jgi:hypothetical protein
MVQENEKRYKRDRNLDNLLYISLPKRDPTYTNKPRTFDISVSHSSHFSYVTLCGLVQCTDIFKDSVVTQSLEMSLHFHHMIWCHIPGKYQSLQLTGSSRHTWKINAGCYVVYSSYTEQWIFKI